MKITIEQKAGIDYPISLFGNMRFQEQSEIRIRKLLELSKDDEVVFIEVGGI